MKKLQKLAIAVATFAVALTLGTPAVNAASPSPVNVKVGHTGNAKSKYQIGMEAFKASVDANSGGRFKLEIFPMSLGGDRELLEGLQIGNVDFAEINTSVISSIVEELGVIDLPFIFKDIAHVNRVLDGKVGDQLLEKVNKDAGIVAVTYWENGFRCFTNNKHPIKTPNDLKGLIMRSMQSSVHIETFKIWGANPTPMAFSEMLTALQQGVIDGHDGNPDTIVTNSMWEFQKYYSESRHFFGAKVLAFSKKFWNSLSDSDKKMFVTAARVARDKEREESLRRFDESTDTLEKKGMNVTRSKDIDIDAFIKSVQPVWETYRKKFGSDLVDSIANG
jgi:tripartite ATP-independent transporter DctP family solute receptor